MFQAKCKQCGDEQYFWKDSKRCPEPCGMKHNRCTECATPQESCPIKMQPYPEW